MGESMKINRIVKECATCGKSYEIKKSAADKSRFCSRECKHKKQSAEKKGITPSGFVHVKHEVHTRVAPAKKCGHIAKKGRQYCKKCREKHYSKRVIRNCAECNKKMSLAPSEAKKYKCCSMACRNKQTSKRQLGEKSHLWKGGLTSENRRLRNSCHYDNWRKAVFVRDDFTCQLCGVRGGKLCADHLKEWALYPALRFDINNGRTLCTSCHLTTENFGNRAYQKMLSLEVDGSLQYRLI